MALRAAYFYKPDCGPNNLPTPVTECVTDLDLQSRIIIFDYLLITLKESIIFEAAGAVLKLINLELTTKAKSTKYPYPNL